MLIICLIIHAFRQKNHQLPYPPGPPSPYLPFGKLSNLPTIKPWLTYVKWGKQYGDLIHFKHYGQHFLILNSKQAINDLLEKQARLTSERIQNPLDSEFSGWLKNLAVVPYAMWRDYRKIFHRYFKEDVCYQYQDVQTEKVHTFLRALRDLSKENDSQQSEKLMVHIAALSTGIMIKSLYGDIESKLTDLPRTARYLADWFNLMILPGGVAWKSLPFVQYLPSYFSFWTAQESCRKAVDEIMDVPFDSALEALTLNGQPSLIGDFAVKNNSQENIEYVKGMGFTAVSAAADTTMSSIATFFLAMTLYPHVQIKAQEELDNVLGAGKLPQFSDRPSLPYVEAVYREVMRWHPAIPLGIAHKTGSDIIYRGYRIPKGTAIFANIWAATHDESVGQDPDNFIPERHMRDDGKCDGINSIAAFGYGRRICLGRYMADATMWLAIASTLATIHISSSNQAVKLHPEQVDVESFYLDSCLCSPRELPCIVTPRLFDC